MCSRVRLTGIGDSGPVWLWLAHVTSVYTYQGCTMVSVAGTKGPRAVQESAEQVLDLIDAAAGGLTWGES